MKNKILAITLIFAITVSNMFSMNDVEALIDNAPMLTSRTVSTTRVTVGDEIIMTYTITPASIPVGDVNVVTEAEPQEIVLVYDKSGSMNFNLAGVTTNDTSLQRDTYAQAAANSFVDKFTNMPNVKVGLVTYSTAGEKFEYNGKELLDSNNETEMDMLREAFTSEPNGGTNIGEAIRLAEEILDNNNDAEKHIVFMTDGEPTGFSYTTMNKTVAEGDDYQIGYEMAYSNDTGRYEATEVYSYISNANLYTGSGTAPHYYVNKSVDPDQDGIYETVDFGGYALEYAKDNAGDLNDGVKVNDDSKTRMINGHYIAFSSNSAYNDLALIAAEHNDSSVYSANDSLALETIYNNIADEIVSEITLTDVYFQDTLPEGLSFVQVPDTLTVDGMVLKGNLANINYILDSAGEYYVPEESIVFTVRIKADSYKDYYVLGKDGSTYVQYTDLDGDTTRKTFPEKVIRGESVFDNTPYFKEITIDVEHAGGTIYEEDSVDLKFTIEGNEVTINDTSTLAVNPKDVVLMLDTSNSMRRDLAGDLTDVEADKRLTIAKTAAKNFIANFAGDNMNVSLVTFDEYGNVQDFGGETFLSLMDADKVTQLNDRIDGYGLTLGTNMGDAFRKTYYELKDRVSEGNAQYIVFLTDGAPYYWMSESDTDSTYALGSDPGAIRKEDLFDGISKGYGSKDYTIKAIEQIADDPDLSVKQYMIGISEGPGLSNLNTFGQAANADQLDNGKYYYEAHTPEDIESTYETIQNSIDDRLPLTGVEFTFDVPDNMKPVVSELPAGYVYDSVAKTITGPVNNATLVKQGDTDKYILETIELTIKFEFDDSADIPEILDTVTLDYTDLAGTAQSFNDGDLSGINIYPTKPTIDPITGDDIVDYSEKDSVEITGIASRMKTVDIKIIDTDTPANAVVGVGHSNGIGDYVSDATFDLSPLTSGPIIVEVSVTDSDGDRSSATRNAEAQTRQTFISNANSDVTLTVNSNDMVVDDGISFTYRIKATDIVTDSTWVNSTYELEITEFNAKIPSNVNITGKPSDINISGTNVASLSGFSETITLERQADGSYIAINDVTIVLSGTVRTTKDISIPEDTIELKYSNNYDGGTSNFLGGNGIAVNVRPQAPSLYGLTDVSGDKIALDDIDSVRVEGHVHAKHSPSDPETKIFVEIHEASGSSWTYAEVTADYSGAFATAYADLDAEGFSDFIVYYSAIAVDEEGDTNSSNRTDNFEFNGPDII